MCVLTGGMILLFTFKCDRLGECSCTLETGRVWDGVKEEEKDEEKEEEERGSEEE